MLGFNGNGSSRRKVVGGVACALLLVGALSACGGEQVESAADSAATSAVTEASAGSVNSETASATSADNNTSAAEPAPAESASASDATSSATDAKQASQKAEAEPAPAVDEALAKRWQEDLTRIADASGMRVCVRAIDLNTGTSVEVRGDEQMVSASMIKLLIAESFLRQVAAGTYSLDGTYVLAGTDIVGGTGSLQGYGAGAEVTYRDLVFKMISESDNVATNVLIDALGMEAINKEAASLGLKASQVNRRMMDMDAAAAGTENYTSANDVALLLRQVYDKTFVNAEMSEFMLQALEAQEDTECISQGLPAGVVFAHKTGTLGTVRHDGGIVDVGGKRPFVLVTLCGGDGFSESAALDTMRQLGEAAYAAVSE